MSDTPNGTPTTSPSPDERPSPASVPERESPPQQLWNSPFVPSKASEWPDQNSKERWIGPFDMYRFRHAKKAREADWKEDKGIHSTRKLAESLYDVDNFAGARYAWAQIADHYISEYQHNPRWFSSIEESGMKLEKMQRRGQRTSPLSLAEDKRDALKHIIEASIGGILNAHLAQYPNLCAAIKANDKKCSWSPHQLDPVLRAVVDHEDNFTSPCALYVVRVMLDYATDVFYWNQYSWLRTVYKRAFEATGQIAGLDLSETLRLQQGLVHGIIESEREATPDWRSSWRSKQIQTHGAQSTHTWKDEVEELYLHIIANQQNLWGITAEATIGSELELVTHYKSIGDTVKAKSKAKQMIILTEHHLGADHDTTLRCIASLSKVLLDSGSIEEAGLVVHDCLTDNPGIMLGSTTMLSLELSEKVVTRRGWKELMEVRNRLEKSMSPFHFIWADYRLYTLRTGIVTFVPCYPIETEKDCAWTLAYQEPKHKGDDRDDCLDDENSMSIREHLTQKTHASPWSKADFEKFALSGFERDHEFLDLQVPYIPYQHFMTTSAFKTGIPYLEYVKAADNRPFKFDMKEEVSADTPIRLKVFEKQKHQKHSQASARASSKECEEIEFDEDSTTTQIQGFFNNIPSEACVSYELHVDLVSTQWADYQHFALHEPPDSAATIEIAEGVSLPYHGYISGTWTDYDVCQQRKVHEVFIVDASFLPPGVNGGTPMFAFRKETMQSSRYHAVTNTEKRAYCARLNPSFYRYKPVPIARPMSVYTRKMAKGTVLTNTEELTLWDEMNRREKWDRDFETRTPTDDTDRSILAQDLKAEDERRKLG